MITCVYEAFYSKIVFCSIIFKKNWLFMPLFMPLLVLISLNNQHSVVFTYKYTYRMGPFVATDLLPTVSHCPLELELVTIVFLRLMT